MSPLTEYVVETLATLLAVCGLAVAVLYGAQRLGVGRPTGPLALVGRLGLDGRRAVYLVRVGSQVYVVGASEAGLAKLGELRAEELEKALETEPTRSFANVLARVTGSRPTSRSPDEPNLEPRDG